MLLKKLNIKDFGNDPLVYIIIITHNMPKDTKTDKSTKKAKAEKDSFVYFCYGDILKQGYGIFGSTSDSTPDELQTKFQNLYGKYITLKFAAVEDSEKLYNKLVKKVASCHYHGDLYQISVGTALSELREVTGGKLSTKHEKSPKKEGDGESSDDDDKDADKKKSAKGKKSKKDEDDDADDADGGTDGEDDKKKSTKGKKGKKDEDDDAGDGTDGEDDKKKSTKGKKESAKKDTKKSKAAKDESDNEKSDADEESEAEKDDESEPDSEDEKPAKVAKGKKDKDTGKSKGGKTKAK
jgi:hypothetical protein